MQVRFYPYEKRGQKKFWRYFFPQKLDVLGILKAGWGAKGFHPLTKKTRLGCVCGGWGGERLYTGGGGCAKFPMLYPFPVTNDLYRLSWVLKV